MGTVSEKEIKRLFDKGKGMNATHMVILTDMSLFEQQVRYIKKSETLIDKLEEYHRKKFKVEGVYTLSMDLGPQIEKNTAKKKKLASTDDLPF